MRTENLIEQIGNLMNTDEDDLDDQSRRLQAVYREAPPEARKVLDEAFICLCGYSMKTLLERRVPR